MSAPFLGRTAAYADRFERIGVIADPDSVARVREEFASWLGEFFEFGANRASDAVLAIYEALANTAEFAYLSAGRPGTVDVKASHDPVESSLTVTVADRGLWRTAAPTPGDRSRGRGIALMKALADRSSIQTSTGGTLVRLYWARVHPAGTSRH
ncbi:MAG: ATP-binding protein [Rhodococcus fascians]